MGRRQTSIGNSEMRRQSSFSSDSDKTEMKKNISKRVSFLSNKVKSTTFTGKQLFRIATRKAMNNVGWMRYRFITPEESEALQSIEHPLLNYKDIVVLMQKPDHRPETALKQIAEKLLTTEAFCSFPLEKIADILSVIRFESYTPNRYIIKRKHQPQGVYIIVRGSILREIEYEEGIYTRVEIVEDHDVKVGSRIGHVDMFFSVSRAETILSGPHGLDVLFLNYKKFFELYSPFVMEKYWDQVRYAMYVCRFYFQRLSKDGIKSVFMHSVFKTVPEGKCLSKKKHHGKAMAMFIISGTVQVVQRLLVQKYAAAKQHTPNRLYKFYENQEQTEPLPDNVVPIFMDTMKMSSGTLIGIGEKIFKHPMYTLTSVTLMLLPVQVLNNLLTECIVQKISLTIDDHCPDARTMFDSLKRSREWYKYKQLMSKSICKSTMNNTTVHNLPLTLRASNIRLPHATIRRIEADEDYVHSGLFTSTLDDEHDASDGDSH